MTRLIDADQFGVISFQGKNEDFIEGAKFILEKIDEAPTITIPVAELDTTNDFAEWIFDSNFTEFGNPYGTYKCSACGGHSSDKYSFCPNCGADMREGEHGEDNKS